MLDTLPYLQKTNFPKLYRDSVNTLQVNLGYRCNLSCTHCHVNAGPKRTELMSWSVMETILSYIERHQINTLDITGGAPETNPYFRQLVVEASKFELEIIDRCNLTILLEPGFEDLGEFLAAHKVNVTASLPCYLEENVDKQRGNGVFEASIVALQKLNNLGYGREASLPLNLVYNPNGIFLPPAQQSLQASYKKELKQRYDIDFSELYVLTNMPISRFGSMLLSKGEFDNYMQLLRDNYSENNLASLMCKSLVSVDWQGYVYDCDFNQMLGLPLKNANRSIITSDKKRLHISELLDRSLTGCEIVVGEHCYGCTAGQGSSCGGALVE